MNKILLVLVFCSQMMTLWATERPMKNINDNWYYLEIPYKQVTQAAADSNWVIVNLPHTWNSEDVVDLVPGYRRNASWYKRVINIQSVSRLTKYFLYFEGVNITSEIYVNGQFAGQHIGGYLGFEIPISSFLKDGANTIMVRADNGYNRQVIPSQKSDFFIYGGITRDVWLKEVPDTFISNLKISTPEVSERVAKSHFKIAIDGEIAKNLRVKIQIKDPVGNQVLEKTVKAENNLEVAFDLTNPKLWHVDHPDLYQVAVSLIQKEEVVDQVLEKYGYRWFEFEENGPFFLNGKRLLLRGTHRHEEHAGVGAAISNEQHRKDMELIKEMGANFLRLGHYPQDPEIYKACDELGILVWDELPWCRGGLGDEVWKTNTKNMLSDIITQNYNHPSIIIWSLGNEIYWLPDFENGDETEPMNTFLSELNQMAHDLDPGRKTAIRKYYAGADIVDVFSPSIWSGWYSGSYKKYETALNSSLKKYPHFLHMEYGGSSHLGRHSEQPIDGDGTVNPDEWEEAINQVEVVNIAKSGDWSENYIVDLFDWHLMVTETHDKFAGNAQWAFKDFGTPLRPENDIPYVNQKGLTDRAGNPKDAFYVFKSYWSDDPFIYIESHTWTERSGPAGKPRNLSIFSNLQEVELFQNGESLGKKTRDITAFPACGLNWDLNFANGENRLRAIGFDEEGNEIEDLLTVNYSYVQAGVPAEIILSHEPLPNGNFLVTATAVDKESQRCLDYEGRVYFQCLSGGDLNENQGTPTGSSSVKMANGKASIEVKPMNDAAEIMMTVLNQDFKGSFLGIETN